MVADDLSCMTICSVSLLKEAKKDLVNMFIGWLDKVLDLMILLMVVLWSIITPSNHWWLR